MKFACDRDELIPKALVVQQLAYLVIPMRQAMLAIPSELRRQLGPDFSLEMQQTAKKVVHESLTQLANLPNAVEPGWVARLERIKLPANGTNQSQTMRGLR